MRPLALDRRALLAAGGALVLGLAGCGGDPASALDPVGSSLPRRAAPPSAIGTALDAIDHLTAGIYDGLATGSGNLAFSPFSITAALAMTVNGAAGRTRRQMLDVLGADGAEALDEGMNALLAHLASLEVDQKIGDDHVRVVLDIADALFVQQGYPYEQPFLDELARDYGAQLETVDFAADPEAARAAVNAWTSDHTAGLIPEIAPLGTVDSLTRLVLVNAVHLLASWAAEFDDPQSAPFRLASGETVAVPMMSGGGADAYRRGEGWQSVRLPYRGMGKPSLAMTVVLPDDGLDVVEQLVRRRGVAGLLPREGTAQVSMPSWSVRTGADLVPLLGALGMSDAFGGTADFSAITRAEQLFISHVAHQAVVKVDQHGTEAAAATAVFAEGASGTVGPPFTVVVDRPFLFVIHDVAHGTPLFVGRVTDPRQT